MPTAESDTCALPLPTPLSSTTPRWVTIRRAAKLWAITLGSYWLVLFIATHVPSPEAIAGGMLDHDKAIHAGAYFVLATLLFITCRRTGATTGLAVRLGLVTIALAYGVFDELTQPSFGRCCSLYDWFADGAGIGAALLLDLWRHPRK